MTYDADIDRPLARRGPRRFGVMFLRWSCESIPPVNVRERVRFPGRSKYRIIAQPSVCMFGEVYNLGLPVVVDYTVYGKPDHVTVLSALNAMERLLSIGEFSNE